MNKKIVIEMDAEFKPLADAVEGVLATVKGSLRNVRGGCSVDHREIETAVLCHGRA